MSGSINVVGYSNYSERRDYSDSYRDYSGGRKRTSNSPPSSAEKRRRIEEDDQNRYRNGEREYRDRDGCSVSRYRDSLESRRSEREPYLPEESRKWEGRDRDGRPVSRYRDSVGSGRGERGLYLPEEARKWEERGRDSRPVSRHEEPFRREESRSDPCHRSKEWISNVFWEQSRRTVETSISGNSGNLAPDEQVLMSQILSELGACPETNGDSFAIWNVFKRNLVEKLQREIEKRDENKDPKYSEKIKKEISFLEKFKDRVDRMRKPEMGFSFRQDLRANARPSETLLAPIEEKNPDQFFDEKGFRSLPELISQGSSSASESHTICVKEYLKQRLPEFLYECMQKSGKVEIFVNPNKDLEAFRSSCSYEIVGDFGAKSSSKYQLVEKDKDAHAVLVSGVESTERVAHLILQFYFSGLDTSRIFIRGDIDSSMDCQVSHVINQIDDLKIGPQIDLFVLGAQAAIVFALYQKIVGGKKPTGPDAFSAARDALRPHGVQIDRIRGDQREPKGSVIRFRGRVIVVLRMPNGRLSGLLTKAILQQKSVDVLFMAGAGGSLRSKDKVSIGSYQRFSKATLDTTGEQVEISDANLLDLPHLPNKTTEATITVASPLVETSEWAANKKEGGFTTVDVESFHILKAVSDQIHSANRSCRRILSGMFISDIVGEESLQDKIGAKAYETAPQLINACLECVGIERVERPHSYEKRDDRRTYRR